MQQTWRWVIGAFALAAMAQCAEAETPATAAVVPVAHAEGHLGETRTVSGFAYGASDATGGFRVSVCEAMTAAVPPDCQGRAVQVRRVPDSGSLEARVGRLQRHGDVAWSSELVEITGLLSREGADVVMNIG